MLRKTCAEAIELCKLLLLGQQSHARRGGLLLSSVLMTLLRCLCELIENR